MWSHYCTDLLMGAPFVTLIVRNSTTPWWWWCRPSFVIGKGAPICNFLEPKMPKNAKNAPKQQLTSVSKKLWQNWHCHCDFSMIFLANSYFIFQVSRDTTFKPITPGDKKMTRIFYEYFWKGLLYKHLVYLIGMRNLEYEKWICQKNHTKVTMTTSMLSQIFKQTLVLLNFQILDIPTLAESFYNVK